MALANRQKIPLPYLQALPESAYLLCNYKDKMCQTHSAEVTGRDVYVLTHPPFG
jgi:hypothetical protein